MQVLAKEAQADMQLNNEMRALWLNQIDNDNGNHGVVNGERTCIQNRNLLTTYLGGLPRRR
jgi:hypothetical protein